MRIFREITIEQELEIFQEATSGLMRALDDVEKPLLALASRSFEYEKELGARVLIDAEKLNIDVIDPILKTITEAQAKVTNSFPDEGPARRRGPLPL